MSQQSPVTDRNPQAGPELDNPGVKFPPPLVFLLAILIGAAIDRFIPLRVLPTGLTAVLGGTVLLLAFILSVFFLWEFFKAGTTIRPDRRPAVLVTTGPFRYSRNPGYIAFAMYQAGIGLWLNNFWMVALLVSALVWIRWRVIALEERYLIRRFGQAYLDYQAKVRRWL